MTELKRVAIVGSARIPFARGNTAYADETNLSMLATTLGGLVEKFGLKGEKVDEVIAGAVINHSRDFNIAREAALDAGLSPRTPGTTLQIACGTSLQAALVLAARRRCWNFGPKTIGLSLTVSVPAAMPLSIWPEAILPASTNAA
jgi:acetyl-CoA C-acetyltransferase